MFVFGIFGVLCFLETRVSRIAFSPYYRHSDEILPQFLENIFPLILSKSILYCLAFFDTIQKNPATPLLLYRNNYLL